MTVTYARLRVLRAIASSGKAPSNTRIDMLRRMQDAGLIGPLADRNEPWFLTQAGRKALQGAESQEACKAIGSRLARIFDAT